MYKGPLMDGTQYPDNRVVSPKQCIVRWRHLHDFCREHYHHYLWPSLTIVTHNYCPWQWPLTFTDSRGPWPSPITICLWPLPMTFTVTSHDNCPRPLARTADLSMDFSFLHLKFRECSLWQRDGLGSRITSFLEKQVTHTLQLGEVGRPQMCGDWLATHITTFSPLCPDSSRTPT